jgi:hypothetical protein
MPAGWLPAARGLCRVNSPGKTVMERKKMIDKEIRKRLFCCMGSSCKG